MAFILLLLLSLTAVVQSEARAASHHLHQARARLNAQYGLTLAVSQLQRYAGPDQRVTATGAITDPSPQTTSPDVVNPHWVGVWDTTHSAGDEAEPVVLISGNEAFDRLNTDGSGTFSAASAPSQYLDFNTTEASVQANSDFQGTVLFLSKSVDNDTGASPDADDLERTVWAPKVPLSSATSGSAEIDGSYAWWVGDENVKAKVSLSNPLVDETAGDKGLSVLKTRGQVSSLFLANRNGIGVALDASIPDLFANSPNHERLQYIGDIAFELWPEGPSVEQAHKEHYHSFSTRSYGLLSDVRHGGLRHDLTVAFDSYTNYAHIFPQDHSSAGYQHQRAIYDTDVLRNLGGVSWPTLAHNFPYFDTLLDYYQLPIQHAGFADDGGIITGNRANSSNLPLTMPRPYGLPSRVIYEDKGHGSNAVTSHNLLYDDPPYNCPNLRYNHANKLGLIPARQQMNMYLRYEPVFDSVLGRTRYRPWIGRQMIIGLYNPYNFSYNVDGREGLEGPYSKTAFYPNIAIKTPGEDPVSFNLSEVRVAETYRPPGNWGIDGSTEIAYRYYRDEFGDTFEVAPGETRLFTPQLGVDQHWLGPMALQVPLQQAWNQNNIIWTDLHAHFLNPRLNNKLQENEVRFDGHSSPDSGTYNIRDSDDFYSIGESLVAFNKDYDQGAPPPGTWGGWGKGGQSEYYGFTSDELDRMTLDGSTGRPSGTLELAIELSTMGNLQHSTHEEWWGNVLRLEDPIRAGYAITDTMRGDPITEGFVSKTFNLSDPEFYEPQGKLIYGFALQLRSAEHPDDTEPTRAMVDFNIRPSAGRVEFEGANDLAGGTGMRTAGMFTFASDNFITPSGQVTAMRSPTLDPAPSMATISGDWRLQWAGDGVTQAVLFDIPRRPLTSIGQFQHAQLSSWSNQPTYAFGNAFRPYQFDVDAFFTTIPRESGNSGQGEARAFDTSYLLNERIWDQYFFSSLSQHDPNSRTDLLSQAIPLANPRYLVQRGLAEPGALDWDRLTGNGGSQAQVQTAFDTVAARLMVDGAFNINSTSVEAWKAVLGNLSGTNLPLFSAQDPSVGSANLIDDADRPLAAFSRLFTPSAIYRHGGNLQEAYLGYRELTESELDTLAVEMVKEVKARGPFLSLADFVNRAETPGVGQSLATFLGTASNIVDETPMLGSDSRETGALQAAILRSEIHDHTRDTLSYSTVSGNDTYHGSAAAPVAGATGLLYPGDVSQADILQNLAPIITARSDTFTIRSYGEYINPVTGLVESEAWCEAVVQRLPEAHNAPAAGYADDDAYNLALRNLHLQGEPQFSEFGRKFRVVSFRWLSPEDV